MSAPSIEQGHVIYYDYLWSHRAKAGARTADKTRPALILDHGLTKGGPRAVILPITHTPPDPSKGDVAIEIPPPIKKHMGLDGDRSWIKLSEANIDDWPPPLQKVPGNRGAMSYGRLPKTFFAGIVQKYHETYHARTGRVVDQTKLKADVRSASAAPTPPPAARPNPAILIRMRGGPVL